MTTLITVTESYGGADQEDLPTGEVIFRLSAPMRDSSSGVEIWPTAVVAEIVAGRISQELSANDDPTTTPPTTGYYVEERILGAPVVSSFVVVPSGAPGATTTLSALKASP